MSFQYVSGQNIAGDSLYSNYNFIRGNTEKYLYYYWQADSCYDKGNYPCAMQNIKLALGFKKASSSDLYYLFLCYSKIREYKHALDYFSRALNRGWYAEDYTEHFNDSSYQFLTKNKKWTFYRKKLSDNRLVYFDSANNEKIISAFLGNEDLRNYVFKTKNRDSLFNIIDVQDSLNTVILSNIIMKCKSWPGTKRFTTTGDHYAFLILQHSDKNKNFQEKVYDLLLQSALNQETEMFYVAYLADRLLIYKYHLKQLFGTQGTVDKNNEIKIFPVYDSSRLDYRRKLVGLNTIDAYISEMKGAISK